MRKTIQQHIYTQKQSIGAHESDLLQARGLLVEYEKIESFLNEYKESNDKSNFSDWIRSKDFVFSAFSRLIIKSMDI